MVAAAFVLGTTCGGGMLALPKAMENTGWSGRFYSLPFYNTNPVLHVWEHRPETTDYLFLCHRMFLTLFF